LISHSFFLAIRSGWQIPGARVKVHTKLWKEDFEPEGDLLKFIQHDLVGSKQKSIRAELDKFLIYGPGDKFKSHKDTIRGKNHFGSLVVFLPSIYQGGELVVKHRDFEKSIQNISPSLESQKALICLNSI